MVIIFSEVAVYLLKHNTMTASPWLQRMLSCFVSLLSVISASDRKSIKYRSIDKMIRSKEPAIPRSIANIEADKTGWRERVRGEGLSEKIKR